MYCNDIGRESSHLKVQVGFWVVTIVEMLSTLQKIDDDHVQVIMPYIIAGLKSKRWAEYQTASSMILSQLSRRLTFTPTVFDTLMTTIATATRPEANTPVLAEWLLLVISLFQSQSPAVMPTKLYDALLRAVNTSSALASIASNYDIAPFMRLFMHQIAANHRSDGHTRRILADIITHVPINAHIDDIVNTLVCISYARHTTSYLSC
jgi:hypothetical protein